MKPVECEFEADALEAALQSRWPGQVDAQFRAHVAECPICFDVVTVATAVASEMDNARDEMRERAIIPDSGRVWWRAQLRARREAAEAAGRPITAAQFVAFASAVGLLGACFGATSTWFQSVFRSIASSLGGFDARMFLHSAIALSAQHGAWVLAGALMLFVVPTAVYIALGRD